MLTVGVLLMLSCHSPPLQLLVCAMGPPGGGRNNITGRFTRHLNIISIESFDDSAMTKIFSALADWHFSKGFDSIFGRLGKVCVKINVFQCKHTSSIKLIVVRTNSATMIIIQTPLVTMHTGGYWISRCLNSVLPNIL